MNNFYTMRKKFYQQVAGTSYVFICSYTILYMTLLGWKHASVTMVQNIITVPNLYPMHESYIVLSDGDKKQMFFWSFWRVFFFNFIQGSYSLDSIPFMEAQLVEPM
jgi:hypothetical protein